ncbi:type I site-specific restriction endonuclease [Bradyrhizobium diazoefficiens]
MTILFHPIRPKVLIPSTMMMTTKEGGVTKIVVSGIPARIIAERIEYVGSDGKLITESYREYARKTILSEFRSLDEFIRRWNKTDRKQTILDELENQGVVLANLQEAVGRDIGDFDLLTHIAYDQPPLTRRERAEHVRKRNYFTKYGDKARAVLETLLDKYADEGISTIEDTKVLRLRPFDDLGTPLEIIRGAFGGKAGYEAALTELEHQIYEQASNK